ncbi:hypothetical protein CFIO01_09238 [Colletotrichum fioriniae PJ7]|uniref:Uncharacterized protein n=1 Tax=Colletotrichum fioriniae PJ7 TaxID=1445577 RepID=A0A010RBH7_9PEZI|nr:hypothetical protein CFIO01_09238 [Colletotrichum fioriniae PJ7]
MSSNTPKPSDSESDPYLLTDLSESLSGHPNFEFLQPKPPKLPQFREENLVAEEEQPLAELPRLTGQQPTDKMPEVSPETKPFISDVSRAKDFEQYSKGSKLVLNYQHPRRPYGRSVYPNPPDVNTDDKVLSEDEMELSRTGLVYHDRHISNPTPNLVRPIVNVTVVDTISTGMTGGAQILLCKVEEARYHGGKDKKPKGISRVLSGSSYRVTKRSSKRKSTFGIMEHTSDPASSQERHSQEQSIFTGPSLVGRGTAGEHLAVGQLVVVKVYDAMYYPFDYGMYQGPWKVTSRADQEHSREAGTYEHLWIHDKTGYPHLAPQYYGSWAIELTTTNPVVEDKQRFARAIAMEYIEGSSIEEISRRTIETHQLVPRDGSTPTLADGTKWYCGWELRLKTLKDLVDGYMDFLHVGVSMGLDPQNIILTGKLGDKKLESPRVVAVDYVDALVDDQLKTPHKVYQPHKMPPHPWGEVSLRKLELFSGWIPHQWTAKQFEGWIHHVYGPLDNPDYTDPRISKAPPPKQDPQPSHTSA